MKFSRSMLPFVMVLCLLVGSVASAATPCCCLDGAAKATETQDMPDMPCHGDTSNTHKTPTNCGNCDCMHHANMGTLAEPIAAIAATTSHVEAFAAQRPSSHMPEGMFQPPRVS